MEVEASSLLVIAVAQTYNIGLIILCEGECDKVRLLEDLREFFLVLDLFVTTAHMICLYHIECFANAVNNGGGSV